jgi:F0F1-type ATP synthase delta subunit
MLFLWLVLLQVLIFGILVLFLRLILARNIAAATSHLNEVNKDYNQRLEEAKKRLLDADKYYDEVVLKAKTDAEKLKAQILHEAHQSQEALAAETHQRSEEIVRQAEKAAESIVGDIERKVDERALDRASELVEDVLPEALSKEMHERWVEELLKNGVDEIHRLNPPKDLEAVKIVSAYPLGPDQKSAIQKRLREKLRHEVKFAEETDAKLLAGLKIVMGSVVLDGSLRFKMKESARRAKNQG